MRVGELGEGFSVVSNDIRNLAENSEQNLDQINDIVDNLEDETESIIEAISQMQYLGVKEADALVVLASDMDQSTEEILYSIDVFKEIENKLDAIDNALSQAKIGAQQTVTAAELSLKNASESTEAAEHITSISQTMAENVSELIEVAALLKDS
jgi:methyl-accepting chemotaxis protein